MSAIPLHLRPGVRQHFMAWLGANRPELVAEYEQRYRRAYLPGKDQDEVAGQVRALVEKARGRYASPRHTRLVGDDSGEPTEAATSSPASRPAPDAGVTQLGLGL